MAEGGSLEVAVHKKHRDRQRWEEAKIKHDALEWSDERPASPGWYVARATEGQSPDSVQRWTVWRAKDGALNFTPADGGPLVEAANLPSAVEWAYVLGSLTSPAEPSPPPEAETAVEPKDDPEG